jgi:hypothetical protein
MHQDVNGAVFTDDFGSRIPRDPLGHLAPARDSPVLVDKVYAVVNVLRKGLIKNIVGLHNNTRRTCYELVLIFFLRPPQEREGYARFFL